MKKITAEIISTGDELIRGDHTDTNSGRLSRFLKELGIDVLYITITGDREDLLKQVLKEAVKRTEVVIVTGGLGPTEDDKTRKAAADVFSRNLVMDEKVMEMIKTRFRKMGMEMPEDNTKQALIPEQATTIYNYNGTAAGFIIHDKSRNVTLAALPGPEQEWTPMFENEVKPFLLEKHSSGITIASGTIRTIGITESHLNRIVRPLFNINNDINYTLLSSAGKVDIEITVRGQNKKAALELVSISKEALKREINHCLIYSEDRNRGLSETIGDLLKTQGVTVSTAESCTAGLLAKRLTDISGSSDYFHEGVVVYSNRAKEKYLGIKKEVINRFGAVSGETAFNMAKGMQARSGADISLGITGIAGPSGGTPEKPVGLVYFGFAAGNYIQVVKKVFNGNRSGIRSRATDYALNIIRLYLGKPVIKS